LEPSLNNKNAFYREAGALAFLFATLLLFYFPVIFGNKTVFTSDTLFFNFPMYHFVHQAYQEGFIPFWNPDLFAGIPFMSVWQSSVFYPPSAIFFMDDFTLAFNLNQIFHHGILVAGTYALMRHWGFSPIPALCSGLTAFLGGFSLSISEFCNHFHSVAWFPWFFLSFEKWLDEKSIRYFLLAVGACALQTLAGSPEFSILSALLIFFHALWVRRDNREYRILKKSLLMGLVVFSALAVTAFQLLPTYQFAQDSIRDFGMQYVDHVYWSLEPSALTHLLFAVTPETLVGQIQSQGKPGFLNSLYMGIVPVSFLAGALLFLKTDRWIRFWWITFWVGIFFALGKFNPLYPLFFDWAPLLHKFRYPEKFFFISAFSATFLAGAVVDFLLRVRETESAPYKKFIGILLGVLTVASAWHIIHPEDKSMFPLLFLTLFILSSGLLLWNRITPPLFCGITLFIILIDLTTHNQVYFAFTDRKFFDEAPPVVETLAQDPDNFRIFSQTQSLNNSAHSPKNVKGTLMVLNYEDLKNILHYFSGITYGVQSVKGHLGTETKDQGIYNHIFNRSSLQKRKRILERFNVKYMISPGNWQLAPDGLIHPQAETLRLNALPRAFMVPVAQVMDLRQIPETYFSSDFDPTRQVLISDPVDWNASPEFEGEVTHLVYKPNRVEIQTRQRGNGFLVLLDTYYPGWKATVDGKEVAILRGNHFFRTLPLDEGDHQVVFYYEQEGFQTGLLISLTALVLLMGGCTGKRILNNKKRRALS
jgi:Bacterial membrane protein YfhO